MNPIVMMLFFYLKETNKFKNKIICQSVVRSEKTLSIYLPTYIAVFVVSRKPVVATWLGFIVG